MKNFISRFIYRTHTIFMNEEDVMDALKALNCNGIYDVDVGNCGWADDERKWSIIFTTNDNIWDSIVKYLGIVRVWYSTDIPKDTEGYIYSKD